MRYKCLCVCWFRSSATNCWFRFWLFRQYISHKIISWICLIQIFWRYCTDSKIGLQASRLVGPPPPIEEAISQHLITLLSFLCRISLIKKLSTNSFLAQAHNLLQDYFALKLVKIKLQSLATHGNTVNTEILKMNTDTKATHFFSIDSFHHFTPSSLSVLLFVCFFCVSFLLGFCFLCFWFQTPCGLGLGFLQVLWSDGVILFVTMKCRSHIYLTMSMFITSTTHNTWRLQLKLPYKIHGVPLTANVGAAFIEIDQIGALHHQLLRIEKLK